MRRVFRLLFVIAAAVLVYALLVRLGAPVIEPGSVLVLDIGGEYIETAEPSLVARLLGREHVPLARLYSELRKVERDDRIAVVVLRIRSLQIGWGKAQEIREAIDRLRLAGRRPIAYLEVEPIGANREYFIATAAEEIHMPPGTRIPFVGLAAEYFFLGGLWERLGIDLEVERIGDFKTAADFLAGKQMSQAHREMANWLLDSIDEQFVSQIAARRGIGEEQVRSAIDAAVASPDELRQAGLIDGVGFLDDIVAAQGDRPRVRGRDYARVEPESIGFDPVARLALVYGTGTVVTGEGANSRTGQPVLASETVSRALKDAAEASDIDGILFRIDSPGGSALASDIVWNAARSAGRAKPLVVSFSDVAASGGYYVACGAEAIVAQPGSITGSIGVLMIRPVLARMLGKLDIGAAALTRGKHADLFVASRALSPASRELLARDVEGVYDLFLQRVAIGREMHPEQVDAIARGRVWTGAQAAKLGLVDDLGGLDTAVARLRATLDLAPDADVALVPYPKPKSVAEQMRGLLEGAVARTAAAPLPAPLRRVLAWLEAVPEGGPVLLPPVLIEIR